MGGAGLVGVPGPASSLVGGRGLGTGRPGPA